MTLLEIEHLLQRASIKDRLDMLDQAYYNGCMIMNERMIDTYKDIQANILGKSNRDRLKKDIERYRMISERLGLKFPKRRD
jgi:hypothetical protein